MAFTFFGVLTDGKLSTQKHIVMQINPIKPKLCHTQKLDTKVRMRLIGERISAGTEENTIHPSPFLVFLEWTVGKG